MQNSYLHIFILAVCGFEQCLSALYKDLCLCLLSFLQIVFLKVSQQVMKYFRAYPYSTFAKNAYFQPPPSLHTQYIQVRKISKGQPKFKIYSKSSSSPSMSTYCTMWMDPCAWLANVHIRKLYFECACRFKPECI